MFMYILKYVPIVVWVFSPPASVRRRLSKETFFMLYRYFDTALESSKVDCEYFSAISLINQRQRILGTQAINYLVCPQTFSHTVVCKVCLTASNTLFDADAFVRPNHRILSNIWRVRFLVVSPYQTRRKYFL